MGFISSAIDSALQGIGESLIETGEAMLEGGFQMWKSCGSVTMGYLAKNPMNETNAWAVVTGNIYAVSMAVAASLAVLFFVVGWLRESIDIRNTFTLENMFRFFIRYVITAALLVNALALTTSIVECSTAIVSTVGVMTEAEEIEGVFDQLLEALEGDEAEGTTYLTMGFGCLIGGLFGGLVIIVCGIQLVLSVLSRLFKLLLCVPFAPVAFAGFAGGHELSSSGIAWLKSFVGYALEAVVIALAISISFGMFADAAIFGTESGATDLVGLILMICEYCMPMIAACACVKGADMIVRRCLGLG